MVVLAAGLWKSNEDIKRHDLGLLVVTALSAIAAYLTGEPAEDAVKGLPSLAWNLMEADDESAGVA